jgi:hypothetical protein
MGAKTGTGSTKGAAITSGGGKVRYAGTGARKTIGGGGTKPYTGSLRTSTGRST